MPASLIVLVATSAAGALGCAHSPPVSAQPPSPTTDAFRTRGPPLPPTIAVQRPPGRARDSRQRVVEAAHSYLGRTFTGDCCSFVLAVFRRAQVALEPRYLPGRSGSEALFRQARPARRPRPGDIAVFHNTYDRNRDGKANDRFTHIAVVESVDGPRVTLIHRGGAGVARIQMNLARPDDRAENSVLRRGVGPRGSSGLAGRLFAGFGVLLPGRLPLRQGAGQRTMAANRTTWLGQAN